MDVNGGDLKRQSLNGPTSIKKRHIYNDFIRRFEGKSEPAHSEGLSKVISGSHSHISAQWLSRPVLGPVQIEINPKVGLYKTGASPAPKGRSKRVKAETEPGFGLHMQAQKSESERAAVARGLADLDRRISIENEQLAILRRLEEAQKVDLLSINANRGALVSKADKTNILLKMESLKRKYLDQALSIVQEHNLHRGGQELRKQGQLFQAPKERLDHTAFWRDSSMKQEQGAASNDKLVGVKLPVLRRMHGEYGSSGKRIIKSSNHSEVNYSRVASRPKKAHISYTSLHPPARYTKQQAQASIEGVSLDRKAAVFLDRDDVN